MFSTDGESKIYDFEVSIRIGYNDRSSRWNDGHNLRMADVQNAPVGTANVKRMKRPRLVHSS